MTHYHYYIVAGSVIDSTTRIYSVGIGESLRQQAIYSWLLAHAKAHNHYFCIRSLESSEFIYRIIHSIDGANLSPVQITARELQKLLTSGEDIPLATGTLHNRHVLRNATDCDYRVSCKLAARR